MAGTRGPVPKRTNQRRRVNRPAGPPPVEADGAPDVTVPPADPEWHPIAARFYESLTRSGQSRFYEPSDWATAVLLAESISRELSPQGLTYQGQVVSYHTMTVKASALTAWRAHMATLMVTEGDRRRLALELTRPNPASEEGTTDVSELAEYRRRAESRSG